MKKLIGITIGLALLVFATQKVEAQSYPLSLISRYALPLDTITNTGTKSLTTPLRVTASGQVTVTTTNTALTGTMKGIAYLYGSNNGVDYQRIRSTTLKGSEVDSLLLDAAHPTYGWIMDINPYNYYQVQTVGIGTTTFTIKALITKKP